MTPFFHSSCATAPATKFATFKARRLSVPVRELIIAPIREHSRKPEEVRIEQLAAGPYIELFAPNTVQGWDSFGNEIGVRRP
jgi:N6-adenosine-specific RNA methylase IME4